jgi:hypothetical protein
VNRFIVGTGRCGSTLLSRMIGEHPDVCSIFECLNGLDVARRFAPEPCSGERFRELLLAEQPFLTAVLRRGYRVEEVVYPFGVGRHRRGDPMPYVLTTMLPRLSDDPDGLLDAIAEFTAALPEQSASDHFRALFGWLAEREGSGAWIERSGSSIEYLPALAAAFPGARFLHLHRDGPETALSMRRHHAYRLPVSVMYRAPDESGRPAPEPASLDFASSPHEDDAISRVLAARPPAEVFGRYWSDQLARGMAGEEPAGPCYRELAFEDLLEHPAQRLREIADFFALDPDRDGWAERAAALVGGRPTARVLRLSAEAQSRLEAACLPGMKLLGRA